MKKSNQTRPAASYRLATLFDFGRIQLNTIVWNQQDKNLSDFYTLKWYSIILCVKKKVVVTVLVWVIHNWRVSAPWNRKRFFDDTCILLEKIN